MIDLDRVRGIVEAVEQSEKSWVGEKIVKDYNEIVKGYPDLQIPLDWIEDGNNPYVDKPDFLSKARGALHRAERQATSKRTTGSERCEYQ